MKHKCKKCRKSTSYIVETRINGEYRNNASSIEEVKKYCFYRNKIKNTSDIGETKNGHNAT